MCFLNFYYFINLYVFKIFIILLSYVFFKFLLFYY